MTIPTPDARTKHNRYVVWAGAMLGANATWHQYLVKKFGRDATYNYLVEMTSALVDGQPQEEWSGSMSNLIWLIGEDIKIHPRSDIEGLDTDMVQAYTAILLFKYPTLDIRELPSQTIVKMMHVEMQVPGLTWEDLCAALEQDIDTSIMNSLVSSR